MMIGRLIQTAIISISSGACLVQAPTFNNEVEPNEATNITVEIDLNKLQWSTDGMQQDYKGTVWDNTNEIFLNYPGSQTLETKLSQRTERINLGNLAWLNIRRLVKTHTIPYKINVMNEESDISIENMYAVQSYYVYIETYEKVLSANVQWTYENTDTYDISQTINNENDPPEQEWEAGINIYNGNNNTFNERLNTSTITDNMFYMWDESNVQKSGTTGYEWEQETNGVTRSCASNINIGTSNIYQLFYYESYQMSMYINTLPEMEMQLGATENGFLRINETKNVIKLNFEQTPGSTSESGGGTSESTSQPTPSNNNEIVDIPGVMFTIIAMPFNFITQAFNLTIFPGTPYQINFSNVMLILLTTLILIFVVRLIMRGK